MLLLLLEGVNDGVLLVCCLGLWWPAALVFSTSDLKIHLCVIDCDRVQRSRLVGRTATPKVVYSELA